jgi:exodeoxyribonuclease-3
LHCLAEARSDVVCLQALKASEEEFSEAAINAADYEAIWHGQKSWNSVAILSCGAQPIEPVHGLPEDPDNLHSRYIAAMIDGVLVGCLYFLSGNPAPGLKFEYKLRWLERLTRHVEMLLATAASVVLVRDYNVIPTELDSINRNTGLMMRFFDPKCAMPSLI